MSLLAAALIATIFAIFGFPFRYYQCWFSWSAWGTLSGMVLYFFLAGGGGGLLGWALGTISHAQPTANQLLNGILYGLGGSLALRADFGVRPKRSSENQFQDAKSMLTKSINWTAESLDDVTRRCADRWLRSLDDDSLILEAYRVHADVANQPPRKLSDKAKAETQSRLVELMEKLAQRPESLERSATVAHLIDFCARYYKSEHLARPPVSKPQARG